MADANASARVESFHVEARRLGVYSQKTIVFAIFVVLFALLSVFVPTFLTVPNLLALLQSVSILGILGLWDGGRGHWPRHRHIDDRCSRRPPRNTSSARPVGTQRSLCGCLLPRGRHCVWFAQWLADCLRGSAFSFHDACIRSLSRRLRPSLLFPCRCRAMESDLYSLSWIGRGDVLGIPKPVIMFAVRRLSMAAFLRLTRLGAFIYSAR